MASSSGSSRRGGGGGGKDEDAKDSKAQSIRPLKEGERILPPTRRPDGTLRKPIFIRAGYVPQDEVAIYQPKGALRKKEMDSLQEVPPGLDPSTEPSKPMTKAAKRNERKKEKRQQAALEKSKMLENDDISSKDSNDVPEPEPEELLASHMSALAISQNPSVVTPPKSAEGSIPSNDVEDIDKKIRALKKKIRLTEALQQKTDTKAMNPDQLEKVSKLEDWRKELKILEDKKAELTT